ncbi:family 20 glycosylhydrolase [Alistipes megaguti]|uniref:family 20 glycosylhydrolase n=1 Tax=Alistipes megaguti TaxID=2364787 RepID=UPI002356FF56|nr:family 20 glycosylhydrolase [Alistipes megaguti]
MKGFPRTLILCLLALLGLGTSRAATPAIKAVYLDFRTQVMTLQAMKDLAREAADNGMNAVVVEWEATFPFEDNLTLRNRFAFSQDEVREFIDFCAKLNLEVIPLQNCFGHSEYILRHERYANLKEDKKDRSQVCPLKINDAEAVFRSIFGEIAAMHPSRYLHIGCDETRLLGHCPACRSKAKEQGIAALYVDYVTSMCRIVSELGKVPMIWADILLKYPEALDRLPKEVIIVDWNYGWKPDHFGKMENLEKSGHVIWGACSLRSHPDNLYLIQWRKHLDNIFDYVAYASNHGFAGIINTSWSTSGTYGYIYDDASEVVNMQPVREVYPHAGFDMLNKAYEAAISGQFHDPDSFLDAYCRNRLGLERPADIETIQEYFNMKQQPVAAAGDLASKTDAELARCLELRERLQMVKFAPAARPIAAHLELMLDIRINYLKFKILERDTQSPEFNKDRVATLLEKLDRLTRETEKLQKRFIRLNKDFLKDPEQSYNEWTYYGKMRNLVTILRNIQQS